MEGLIVAVVLLVVGAIIAAVRQSSTNEQVYGPARDLQRKFQSLGDMRGKTKAEIESVVGPPNSFSALSDGTLCQWIRTGYHISLIFKDDVCLGVSSEYVAP